MKSYKVLNKQFFSSGNFSIVPIRMEDRFDIMKWRNEQIYHLRQDKPLTLHDQDRYFKINIEPLFSAQQPMQILFSFLENKICIGYGGLVHINWADKNAEISFIMDTKLEKERFEEIWLIFLDLLEYVAFNDLNLMKIYTYAFDLRPKLFKVLESSGFCKDTSLKNILYSDKGNVVIHSKQQARNKSVF